MVFLSFSTEASVDLADDEQMMPMMHDARFESVFLGIETPDEASLETARKVQNTRNPLDAAVDRITANGIRVMAGFIIGFDGEKDGAGRRIVDFVTRTAHPRRDDGHVAGPAQDSPLGTTGAGRSPDSG